MLLEDRKGNLVNDDFDWEVHPELDEFIKKHVSLFLSNNNFANELSDKMLKMTSTRFVDWIDHIVIPESAATRKDIEAVGMEEVENDNKPEGSAVFKHMRSYLFPIVLSKGNKMEIAIKPESIEDFLQFLALGIEVEGKPFSHLRKAEIKSEGDYILSAVERRGYDGLIVKDSDDIEQYIKVLDLFYTRRRYFDTDAEGIRPG